MNYETQAVALCEHHPPLSLWPMENLIHGTCPKCGTIGLHTPWQFVRMISARKLIEAIDAESRR